MLAALDEADADEARDHYHTFVRRGFHVVDKSVRFQDAWFYPVLCEHVHAFIKGELRRIVVVTPPGTFKSGLWSFMAPAFAWLHHPWMRFIVSSNEKTLVSEHASRCRDILRSTWYRRTFRPTWRLRRDVDAKQYYETTEGGARRGVSVGSDISGKKAHRIIVDDLHDARRVKSPVVRRTDKLWFWDALFDRQIDPKTSGVAIIGHRTDRDDIHSEAIADGWPVLHLPEEWEERFRKTYPIAVGGISTDVRRDGDFLRPAMFGEEQKREVLESVREDGIASWHTKNQGDPKTSAGSLFPPELARTIPVPPVGTSAVRFWDTAATDELEPNAATASWTCGILIGKAPSGRFVVLDRKRKRLAPDERDQLIVATAYEDRHIPGVTIKETVIEHPGGSGGKQAAQIFVRKLAGFNVRIMPTSGKGSKLARAGPVSSQWRGQNVDIVDGTWVKSYKDAMENAHNSTERDDMDATSGGFNALVEGGDPGLPQTKKNPAQVFKVGTFNTRPRAIDEPY